MRSIALAPLLASLMFLGCGRGSAPSHEGTWTATSALMAGTPFPRTVTESITLELSRGDYTTSVAGQVDRGTCKFDRASSPRRMEIQGTEGPNQGRTFLAIYDFQSDDTMRVSYDLKGLAYPTGFESTARNGYFVVVYARKK